MLVRRHDGDVRSPPKSAIKSTIYAVLDRHGPVRCGGGRAIVRAPRRSLLQLRKLIRPVGQDAVDFADAGPAARLSRDRIGVFVKSEFVRGFNAVGLSSPKAKIFHFRFSEICGWLRPSHPRGEGRLAIVTNVGVGCGGRRQRRRDGIAGRVKARERVSRARKTNGAEADGKSVWSWHPLLVSSRRRSCEPNRARQTINSSATEARRIRLRGEHAISRKTIACGNAG